MFPQPQKISKKKTSSPKLYTKCNELPIHNYNEIDSFGNFDFLKLDPKEFVDEETLYNTWLGILDEVLQLSVNKVAINLIKKKINVILLNRRLKVLYALKTCLDLGINVDDQLKEYKTSKEKLKMHTGMLKNDILRLQPKQEENPEEERDTNINNLNFENSIVVLLENGYQIDRFKTVVTTWLLALNRLEKQKSKK